MVNVSAAMAAEFVKFTEEVGKILAEIGPNPVK